MISTDNYYCAFAACTKAPMQSLAKQLLWTLKFEPAEIWWRRLQPAVNSTLFGIPVCFSLVLYTSANRVQLKGSKQPIGSSLVPYMQDRLKSEWLTMQDLLIHLILTSHQVARGWIAVHAFPAVILPDRPDLELKIDSGPIFHVTIFNRLCIDQRSKLKTLWPERF